MNDSMPPANDHRVGEILAIFAKETGVDPAVLRPEATIQELGIASIDMVQAVFALESHFDIEIPVVSDRAGAEFATVGDLIAHVLATLDHAKPVPGAAA
jgi:acyl carrier protein